MAYNSAYYYDESYDDSEPEYVSEENQTERSGSENEKPEIRQNRSDQKNGSVMKIIMVSVLAVAMLSTVIYTLNRRNTMYNKVAAVNHELDLIEAENARLQSELESKMSARNVEEYAEDELGMQKIDSSQIKYIKIQTGDVVNIPEKEKGFFAKIKGLFEKCVEYFRG